MAVREFVLVAFGISVGLAGCALEIQQGIPDVRTPRVFATDAAWTWFNDERAVFVGPRLYIGYVDTSGLSAVSVANVDSDEAPGAYRLSSFRQVDDHNNPALLPLEDGRLLAAYAQHHVEPFSYWRLAEVRKDSLAWLPEQRLGPLGAKTTYSNLFRLSEEDGRIYNFFRGFGFDPTFVTSDDGGANWKTPQYLIQSGDDDTRPYVKYVSDGKSRIDLLFTQAHPIGTETNVYHVFYRDGYLHRSDGTRIQRLPGEDIGPMPVEAGTLVYDAGQAGRGWVWDLEYDTDGAPVAAFVAARDSTVGNDLRYRCARWDEDAGRWQDREIAFAGTRLYEGENHYAGGITIDPSDTNVLYTSSDVHPATGDTTAHYQIYRGIIDGESTTWTVLTPGATADNIRPFVTRGTERQALLWLRGVYTAYENFDTDVVGLLDP